MIKYFNISQLTASSASVESYFNDLKNRSFHNDNLPIRADRFIRKHIKEIESMLKLAQHVDQFEQKIEMLEEIPIKNEIFEEELLLQNKRIEDFLKAL